MGNMLHSVNSSPNPLPSSNSSLLTMQVIRGIPLGVGQIFACGALGPSLLILGAVLLYSPLLAVHALLGSAIGTLAGESVCLRGRRSGRASEVGYIIGFVCRS